MERTEATGWLREQFDGFCRKRRLAGTEDNRSAAGFLKEQLQRTGFTPFEEPIFTLSRWRLAVSAAFVAALTVRLGDPLSLVLFVVAAGPLLRVWWGRRRQTPAAVYGVRGGFGSAEDPGSFARTDPSSAGGGIRPTVILCAHYDAVSVPFPFSGSVARVTLSAGVVMVAVGFLRALHPAAGFLAALLVLGAFAFALLGGNASPGADDNASGVFAVLECVNRLGHPDGVNVVPVFFNFEEQGLLGSRTWVRRHLSQKGQGLSGITLDRKNTYVANFDCVGRGKRLFIGGSRRLRERLLRTAAARALGVSRTWLYPSDHLAFRPWWKAVSFVRANRFWALDLGWVHSRRDVPAEVRLDGLAELAGIVEEFVQGLSLAGGC